MDTDGDPVDGKPGAESCCLQSFRLYETRLNFYMIGKDRSRTLWRVLKIDRSENSELNIYEDPTMYSESECHDLVERIHEGNRPIGGLKFITKCYGIIGFVKFLGPYYMLLITKRRKIGAICGRVVYAISKSKIIMIPHSTVRSSMAYSKDENRYRKLLCTVDLTKDFFFSYSYRVMYSLQKNFCDGETGQVPYETMFVWNEFLTRRIRIQLQSTMWTVALVYGFFKQAKLSISEKDFKLTLIARRSRHFAGTRYLKRGVNEKGRVANDVETEQIVFEDTSGDIPTQISSVLQVRGSIPLFWSQEASWLNIKPDIILHKKDTNYEATRLHFDNLAKRYGNPIIILNLIKRFEKKPRESILRKEFAKAITHLNKDLSEENRLRFLHLDLHNQSRRKATNVLALLGKVAAYALDLTGSFYCQVPPAIGLQSYLTWPTLVKDNGGGWSCISHNCRADEVVISGYKSREENMGNSCISGSESRQNKSESDGNYLTKPPMFQKGILRTNCIDGLDRTNVAQYSYGLVALGHQLHTLGFTDVSKIDLDDPLADDLVNFYERMGDTLALQYGGSAAHNKIFSERRGQWKAATQSQELFKTIQRYCRNTYMDAEKQDAINLFLGHFQPQQGKPALWELDSDQHFNVGIHGHSFSDENARPSFKRSLSDGNILCESNTSVSSCSTGQEKLPNSQSHARMPHLADAKELADSRGLLDPRHLFPDSEYGYSNEHGSNFLDLDWLSSSGNSCEEEIYDRFSIINSPVENLSAENVMDGVTSESTSTLCEKGDAGQSSDVFGEFSDAFVRWVAHGLPLSRIDDIDDESIEIDDAIAPSDATALRRSSIT